MKTAVFSYPVLQSEGHAIMESTGKRVGPDQKRPCCPSTAAAPPLSYKNGTLCLVRENATSLKDTSRKPQSATPLAATSWGFGNLCPLPTSLCVRPFAPAVSGRGWLRNCPSTRSTLAQGFGAGHPVPPHTNAHGPLQPAHRARFVRRRPKARLGAAGDGRSQQGRPGSGRAAGADTAPGSIGCKGLRRGV